MESLETISRSRTLRSIINRIPFSSVLLSSFRSMSRFGFLFIRNYCGSPYRSAQRFLKSNKSYLAWNYYGKCCRFVWRFLHPRWVEHPTFAGQLFVDGQFPVALVDDFVEEALRSPQVPFRINDAAPKYYYNQSTVVPYVD